MHLKAVSATICGLAALTGLITPASATSGPAPESCDFAVTAAGNGYQAHHGPSMSAPSAGTMYTGEVVEILIRSTTAGDGYTWQPDESDYNGSGGYSNDIWWPFIDPNGTYLMTRVAGSCEVLGTA